MSTVAVDFDGVLHTYEHGWQDGTIYGDLMPGALDALHRLMRQHAVFIHTTRDAAKTAQWLVQRTNIPAVTLERLASGGALRVEFEQRTAQGSLDGETDQTLRYVHFRSSHCTVLTPFWNERERLLVTDRKLPALAYVDDRGVHFQDWTQTLDELRTRGLLHE